MVSIALLCLTLETTKISNQTLLEWFYDGISTGVLTDQPSCKTELSLKFEPIGNSFKKPGSTKTCLGNYYQTQ